MNGKSLAHQYKEFFSDFRQWNQLGHAREYLLFPENIGPNLCIDESSLSCGELYTFVTNPAGHGGKGSLVAVIEGTKSERIIQVLEKIQRNKRVKVRDVTLDLSPTMMLVARTVFPKATITNDRFHVHKLFYEAIDELRVSLRWMARDLENNIMAECRREDRPYVPFRYANGDTRKQLLARAKYILMKHSSKWTDSQRWRAEIIFEFYPELKEAYELALELTSIFNRHTSKNTARLLLAHWYDRVEKLPGEQFITVLNTFHNHYDTILNFFEKRSTNAFAESFNAKVKAFRAQFHGVTDIPFFLYRLSKLCA